MMRPFQDLIAAVEQADSSDALLVATENLAGMTGGAGDAEAIDCLIRVLGFNNPGASVAAVEGLIAIGTAAVQPLLATLDEHNYGARAWAVRALAGIRDVRGLELLEGALGKDVGPSVRRAAARGLGQLSHEGLQGEERERLNGRCLTALEAACRDGEWVVRYAVVVGLESLALTLSPESDLRRRAQDSLSSLAKPCLEDTPVVRLRAELALRRLNERAGDGGSR
ncbi:MULTISPECIES: HEAT repeat domain-containing protein [unclassified Cyanobium]|uniref:HEAT repeat domain-containing protein n=1 Tax=unclassified Cyanobium TaxID=2627006 RepID=UPI0020CE9F72|nr:MULTISPECIES: HEAT repeat domain-containing protein [unclassified Cyanobium]MCP9835038.1 HEAT repeat domain-containing protein [Cyanobium sp. La Preciosa 7G6]MCP9937801.1 HEAT repeat domain-containing protein [Cyanobium sp. Aljojuca 7A6]